MTSDVALNRQSGGAALDIDMSADLCTALELEYPTSDVHGFPPDS